MRGAYSPTILIDKSTFEALNRAEAIELDWSHYWNMPPTLVAEILGDLTKEHECGRDPHGWVKTLARKFGGSGPIINIGYRTLCVGELFGAVVPMERKIVPFTNQSIDEHGETIGFIGLSEWNRAILRWAVGDFREDDLHLSKTWRDATRAFGLSSFEAELRARTAWCGDQVQSNNCPWWSTS